MTISLDENSGKGSGVNEKSRSGRVIVLLSIASIIAFNAVIFFLPTPIRLLQYWFFGLIILICYQLYIGSRWAKWVIGVILIFYGGYGIFQFPPVSDISLNPMRILFIFLIITSMVSGICLISSKSVIAFLYEQPMNRNIVARRKSIGLIVTIFILLGITNNLLFPNKPTQLEVNYSEIVKKMKSSMTNLNTSLKKVFDMSQLDTVSDIEEGIKKVEDAQKLFLKAKNDIDAVINFVKSNKNKFVEEDLDYVVRTLSDQKNGRYGEAYKSHQLAMEYYLQAYLNFLKFCHQNYDLIIKENKNEIVIYDKLHSTLEEANRKRIDAYEKEQLILEQIKKKFEILKKNKKIRAENIF